MTLDSRGSGVSFQQLRLFVSLAKHRSFTRAGRALGITQSAASRSIRELEEQLALRLFDRTTRTVELTDTGRALLPRIAPLVDELETALCAQQHQAWSQNGVVSLACSGSLMASVLPPMLASLRVSFPNISLNLHDVPGHRVIELVRAGRADIGLITDNTALDSLISATLFIDTDCAVVPLRHPLAARASLSWHELDAHALFVLDDLNNAVHRPNAQRLSQASSVIQMSVSNLGIGILPASACKNLAHALVRIVPLTPPVHRPVKMVRLDGVEPRPPAGCVWNHIAGMHAPDNTQAAARALV